MISKNTVLVLLQLLIIIPIFAYAIQKIIDVAIKIWKKDDFRKKWLLTYIILVVFCIWFLSLGIIKL